MRKEEKFTVVEIGLAKMFLGSCFGIIPRLGKIGCCVTDPPYGCSATSSHGGKYDGFSIVGDEDTAARDWIIANVDAPFVMFGSPRVKRPECKATLIWNKGDHTGMGDLRFPWKPDYEEIYINGEGFSGPRTSSVLSVNARIDSDRHHPTEKPVFLMGALIRKCPKGTILDPFMGSCSTGVAAVQQGRKFIGIEIEEKYFSIACRRVEEAQKQMEMF